MKTIFAMALVGLLSISSLAEARSVNKTPKPERAQRSPSSAELNCSGKFTKIEDKENKVGGDFCISKKVENKRYRNSAESNCQKQDHDGKKAYLCKQFEWTLACNEKGNELEMKNLGTFNSEWVADLSDVGGQVMGSSGSGCDLFGYSYFDVSYGSRCCLR